MKTALSQGKYVLPNISSSTISLSHLCAQIVRCLKGLAPNLVDHISNMLTDFITPVDGSKYPTQGKPFRFFGGLDSELDGCRIAILGVKDGRGHTENMGTEYAPDFIRRQLYQLHNFPASLEIIDLGDILAGDTFNDTHRALTEVQSVLQRKGIISIILGGDMSLTLAQFKGLAHEDIMVDLAIVDERVVISIPEDPDLIHENTYLYHLLTHKPTRLRDLKVIGYQTYFNQLRDLELLEQMQIEFKRLGALRQDMMEVEPMVRDADMLAFNISAIKACDAPGYIHPGPNGFFSDEACQITRFAGASDKMTSLGIYNYNPEHDHRNITALGIAQMIWYFIEGIEIRKGDYPVTGMEQFQKFIVTNETHHEDIIFLKSLKSDRWWLHVPVGKGKSRYFKMVPCTYKDYLTALENEIPERWISAYVRNN